jgi:prevent-host-death family protein
MGTVSAADFQKKFGRYRDQALREPVTITHHGRASLVVISAEEFSRLKALDDRRAVFASELPDDLAEELARAKPPVATKQFDHE